MSEESGKPTDDGDDKFDEVSVFLVPHGNMPRGKATRSQQMRIVCVAQNLSATNESIGSNPGVACPVPSDL